jgi:hypothetical protein
MTTDINGGTAGPFNTQIPALADNADIQQALRVYHYGSNTTNPSPLPEESIAGHLNTLTNNKISLPSLISGSSTNLNNYDTTGFYHQASSANATSGTNYPPNTKAGMLEVLVEGGVVYQTYTMADNINIKYWRIKFAGTWSSWKTSTDQITGSASTITTTNLTANRTLITGAGQKVEVSPVTSTELGTLTGITTSGSSTIQSQLNTKPTMYNTSGTVSNTRIFVQQLEPNSTNNSGYTPQAGDLWFW